MVNVICLPASIRLAIAGVSALPLLRQSLACGVGHKCGFSTTEPSLGVARLYSAGYPFSFHE
jgi:hypothetical protein